MLPGLRILAALLLASALDPQGCYTIEKVPELGLSFPRAHLRGDPGALLAQSNWLQRLVRAGEAAR